MNEWNTVSTSKNRKKKNNKEEKKEGREEKVNNTEITTREEAVHVKVLTFDVPKESLGLIVGHGKKFLAGRKKKPLRFRSSRRRR